MIIFVPINKKKRYIGNARFNVTGVAQSRSADEPNKLLVNFDNGSLGDYNVWETDYESYALVYSCKPITSVLGLQLKSENVWILSRSKTLSPVIVERLRTKLQTAGVDPSNLSIVQQDC